MISQTSSQSKYYSLPTTVLENRLIKKNNKISYCNIAVISCYTRYCKNYKMNMLYGP